ncbi:hypothetical protein IAT38_007141 [Cryptococcus sp. DSM 104549]
MATASDTNMSLISILSGTALAFALQHTYKFDKWKCLLPKKKEWFRVLLTWMLIGSNAGLFIWAAGWCYAKYKLKWVYVPEYGPMPVPPVMFPTKYVRLNTPLTIVFSIAFSLQTSLNAEVGLYWYHLMRAVRQPKSARSWLTSSFFTAWIVISIISTTLQSAIGWIHKGELDLTHQMSIVMAVDGVVEFVVMAASSIVIWRFPAFLRTVKASGAGPEVRSRLHFYHEANKFRTFFRATFSIGMVILGADGLTTSATIANTPLASDLISQATFLSFMFVLLSSFLLLIPRDWSPPTERNHIMVGHRAAPHQRAQAAQLASGVALMSLLREGGQWDDDDDLRAHKTLTGDQPFSLGDPKLWEGAPPLPSPGGKEEDWESERNSGLGVPMALENFTSPIAVQVKENNMPTEIRIRVEQEVHQDRGDQYV